MWEGGEVAQTMYTHVSKCKNNKIKGEKKKVQNMKSQNFLHYLLPNNFDSHHHMLPC
jgi:hypothetical protein